MKQFFSFFFASCLGTLITGFLGFLLVFFIISGIISSATEEKVVEVDPNSVLLIQLNQNITDRASNNPFEGFASGSFRGNKSIGLKDIIDNIKKAKTDENIKGIYLEMTGISAGMATLQEIRNALLDFKSSGKFIVSYADYYSIKTYYIASVAKKIYMNPEGEISFLGMGVELMFYKKALEKIGVEPEIIRHGKFKSYVEPFMYDKMSDENRQQISTFVNTLWNEVLKAISEERKITIDELNRIADNALLKDSKSAMELKMIDSVKYKDQIIDELKILTGIKKKNQLKVIELSQYTKVKKEESEYTRDKIAVIYASGSINMGEGDSKSIGSDKLSATIRKAREDSSIKAIVLRVNSPGGSALASEIIWREVKLARKVKPFIVSMGDVAASGGYYIACAADTIVANPTTITGSIGVFGLLFNAQNLLNDKLGITTDRYNTNKLTDIGNPYRKMKPEEKAIYQESVEHIYQTFISHVAEGRRMTIAQVDSIGQGRVWSGEWAKKIGLIDVFGGIETAIKIAVEKSKLKKYRITYLPEQKPPFEQLMEELTGDFSQTAIKKQIGESYKYLEILNDIMKMKGVQARIPYAIDVN